MKKKVLSLTLMSFVLLTSLVFAKDSEELINRKELSLEIETQIHDNLPARPEGNYLNEDPLGYLSITEIKELSYEIINILQSEGPLLLNMSDLSQFNVMSYVVDMNDKKIFKSIIKIGYSPKVRVELPTRNANIFTQIVLSENKDALDYLYISLPNETLINEMYYALQSLIKTSNKDKELSDDWYSKTIFKYRKRPALGEDLAQAVLYGKKEGLEELKIAYRNLPTETRAQELYRALLILIYYHIDNIGKK